MLCCSIVYVTPAGLIPWLSILFNLPAERATFQLSASQDAKLTVFIAATHVRMRRAARHARSVGRCFVRFWDHLHVVEAD